MVLPKPDYDLMTRAMQDACAAANLEATDYFMLKVHPSVACLSLPALIICTDDAAYIGDRLCLCVFILFHLVVDVFPLSPLINFTTRQRQQCYASYTPTHPPYLLLELSEIILFW